jgi:hypothetical protein
MKQPRLSLSLLSAGLVWMGSAVAEAQPSTAGLWRVFSHQLEQASPGVSNWLDPAGHLERGILFRLQKSSALVQPSSQLVSLAELPKHLPVDVQAVNSMQRQQRIALRRAHAAKRWSP